MKHLQSTKGRLAFTDVELTRIVDDTIRIETFQDQLVSNVSLAAWVNPQRARELAKELEALADEIERKT